MKILSRDFTLKEKILLVVLCVLLVGLAYYWLVFIPCRDNIDAAHADRDAAQDELIVAMLKENQLKQMQSELDRIGELQAASRMESYNASKAELTTLNNVLEAADDYAVSFSGVTRNGDQIRRNFTLQFRTGSFQTAKAIVSRLSDSEYRCLLGDLQYATTLRRLIDDERAPVVRVIEDRRYAEDIVVTTTATFFETMYGGTPDAGLPADEAAS